jgi:hypothetical protein
MGGFFLTDVTWNDPSKIRLLWVAGAQPPLWFCSPLPKGDVQHEASPR